MPKIELLHGDSLEILKQFPDNHFDSLVVDPPYGLGIEPDPLEILPQWLEKGYAEIKGKGFMGKEWDAFVPQPILWKEIYRVLKPGAHGLIFAGSRTQDWMGMSLRLAGFEIRDTIAWIKPNSMPKSLDISKGIDKKLGAKRTEVVGQYQPPDMDKPWNLENASDERTVEVFSSERKLDIMAPVTDEAKKWSGWGSGLKPTIEPILLVRKPISEKTIVDNVLKWGTGGVNIDAGRIAIDKDLDASQIRTMKVSQRTEDGSGQKWGMFKNGGVEKQEVLKANGRWPSNVVFTHHEDCELIGMENIKGTSTGNGDAEMGSEGTNIPLRRGKFTDRTNEDGTETIEKWNCHSECPVDILNKQVGIKQSGKNAVRRKAATESYHGGDTGNFAEGAVQKTYGDKGYPSRFFYCGKVSKKERGESNFHPTVKPIALMRYLVKLITPVGGTVLDAFGGSGSTGLACKEEGFDCVLIEKDDAYFEIMKKRVNDD